MQSSRKKAALPHNQQGTGSAGEEQSTTKNSRAAYPQPLERATVSTPNDSIWDMASQLLDTFDSTVPQPAQFEQPHYSASGGPSTAVHQVTGISESQRTNVEADRELQDSPVVTDAWKNNVHRSSAPLIPNRSSKRPFGKRRMNADDDQNDGRHELLAQNDDSEGSSNAIMTDSSTDPLADDIQQDSSDVGPQSLSDQVAKPLPFTGKTVAEQEANLMALNSPSVTDLILGRHPAPRNIRANEKEHSFLNKIKKTFNGTRRLFKAPKESVTSNFKQITNEPRGTDTDSNAIAVPNQSDHQGLLSWDRNLEISDDELNGNPDISPGERFRAALCWTADNDLPGEHGAGEVGELPSHPINAPLETRQSTLTLTTLLSSSPEAHSTPRRLRLVPSLDEYGHRTLKTLPREVQSVFDPDQTTFGHVSGLDVESSPDVLNAETNIVKRKNSEVNLRAEFSPLSKKTIPDTRPLDNEVCSDNDTSGDSSDEGNSPVIVRKKKHPSPNKDVLDGLSLQLQAMEKENLIPSSSDEASPSQPTRRDIAAAMMEPLRDSRGKKAQALSSKTTNKLMKPETSGNDVKGKGRAKPDFLSTTSIPSNARATYSGLPQPASQGRAHRSMMQPMQGDSMFDEDELQSNAAAFDIGMRRV